MREKILLDGEWKLFYYDHDVLQDFSPSTPTGADCVSANVPGNVEIALADAGVIPKELYCGMATVRNEVFETYDWWYQKSFSYSKKDGARVKLCFDAVDCYAEYYLNGVKIGTSDNAFTPVSFDVTELLTVQNTLFVHISPTVLRAFEKPFCSYLASTRPGFQGYVRKPAYSFGWDIFPRAVSAGIVRSVYLTETDGYGITEFGAFTEEVSEGKATVRFFAITDIPYREYRKDVQIRITGACGESRFECVLNLLHFKAGSTAVDIANPLIWWPYGYGDANVYDICYELVVDGEVKDFGKTAMGIRTVKLERTKSMTAENHCFRFLINGVPIMCRGSNWVPTDAYQSRAGARNAEVLRMFSEAHCNIVRIWGGGVYETDDFYDYCDRNGIMVWQDFCMACFPVSMDSDTVQSIKQEAESAVKRLRSHPSLILWSGDNEIDETNANCGVRPGINIITREILPQVVAMNDWGRPYLESSPYIADEIFAEYKKQSDIFPERHLWGVRDYYKSAFYAQSHAHFVSETGYHGCPCRKTLEKTVDPEYLWPPDNEQWALHSSDQNGSLARIKLMQDQVEQLFGAVPNELDDFIAASQISQAEAKKFFIERIRIKKPYTSGVIWWNMQDGWPQMSDAVIDYFFEKKLAFYYIKKSQEPFALMIDEMKDHNYTLVASNDTQIKKRGTFRVFDIETDETLCEGDFSVAENQNKELAKLPMTYAQKRFLVLVWNTEQKTFFNHYLCGMPSYDLKRYRKCLEKYASLSELFE